MSCVVVFLWLFSCIFNFLKFLFLVELKWSKESIVVLVYFLVSEVGKLMLEKGGNVVDVVVVIVFVIFVVELFFVGIGGGGFLLLGIFLENFEI